VKDDLRPDFPNHNFDLSPVEDVTPEEGGLVADSLNIGAIAPMDSGNAPPLLQGKLGQIGTEKTTDARD
jgi:hypothetical protein